MANYPKADLIAGLDPDGNIKVAEFDADGNLKTTVSGGGGGGSGITEEQVTSAIESAANIDSVNTKLDSILDSVGSSIGVDVTTIYSTIVGGLKLLDKDEVNEATIKGAGSSASSADTALVTASRDLDFLSIALNNASTTLFEGDVTGYTFFVIKLNGSYGTVSFTGGENSSNLGAVFVEFIAGTPSASAFTSSVSSGNGSHFKGNIYYEYLKITGSSGTTGTITLFKSPPPTWASRVQVVGTPSVLATISSVLAKAQSSPATGTVSSSGDNTVISAPGAGLRIYITKLQIQSESNTATTVLIKSGASTIGRIRCVSDGDGKIEPYAPGFERRLGANEALILNLSGANAIGYEIEYYVAA